MKKIMLSVVLMAVITLSHAQFTFGAKAGMNVTREKFTNTSAFSVENKLGFNIGLAAKYMFAPKFGVAINASFSKEGTKEKSGGIGETSGTIYKKYYNIPLVLQYLINPHIYIEAGPQLGLLSSSKETFGTDTKIDTKNNYFVTDYRFCVGTGYQFTKCAKGLSLGVRYNESVTKTNKRTLSTGDSKNQVFSVDATYLLSPKIFKKHHHKKK